MAPPPETARRVAPIGSGGGGAPDKLGEALIKAGKITGHPGGGQATVGERIFQFEPGMLTFSEEAAPVTPNKPQ